MNDKGYEKIMLVDDDADLFFLKHALTGNFPPGFFLMMLEDPFKLGVDKIPVIKTRSNSIHMNKVRLVKLAESFATLASWPFICFVQWIIAS